MKFDFHTHHERCGHAKGKIRDYIEAAIEAGLDMIGISDHSPYFGSDHDHPHPGVTMATSEFPHYVREVLELKKEYEGKIDVLLGVESDFFPEHADVYRKELAKYPFDFIIGSVHQSDGVSIFNKRRWNNLTKRQQKEQKDKYFELVAQSARSGMFDILGHIDAMKAYYPEFNRIETDSVDRALQVIGQYDVAIEINTSGKTKLVGGWYPSDDILERALFYDVKVTFGSDAHVPSRIGDEWELVRKRLREIGYREWAYFKERKRYMTSL